MITFRTFRNSDAPHLVTIWNEAFPRRSAYTLRSQASLERWIFSKSYFDPVGMIVAVEGGVPIGFVHAGFGCNTEYTALNPARGIICMVAVRLAYRRRKIGTELVKRAEAYLSERGSQELYAGSVAPQNPFYFGLYGGSNSPGFLLSDAEGHLFLKSLGYRSVERICVYQRRLDRPIAIPDHRFPALRRRYQAQFSPRLKTGNWWQENILGLLEPTSCRLVDTTSKLTVASGLYWIMEGYDTRWHQPAVGVMDVVVAPEFRRLGIGKFLFYQLLEALRDQHIGIVEMHAAEDNKPANQLLRSVGFAEVDQGLGYRKG